MEFYNYEGKPIAYCEDKENIYLFSGQPVAYFYNDLVYGYNGILYQRCKRWYAQTCLQSCSRKRCEKGSPRQGGEKGCQSQGGFKISVVELVKRELLQAIIGV